MSEQELKRLRESEDLLLRISPKAVMQGHYFAVLLADHQSKVRDDRRFSDKPKYNPAVDAEFA